MKNLKKRYYTGVMVRTWYQYRVHFSVQDAVKFAVDTRKTLKRKNGYKLCCGFLPGQHILYEWVRETPVKLAGLPRLCD